MGDGQAVATAIFVVRVVLLSESDELSQSFADQGAAAVSDLQDHTAEVRDFVEATGIGTADMAQLDELLTAWTGSLDVVFALDAPITLDASTFDAAVQPYNDLRRAA